MGVDDGFEDEGEGVVVDFSKSAAKDFFLRSWRNHEGDPDPSPLMWSDEATWAPERSCPLDDLEDETLEEKEILFYIGK